MSVLSLPYLPFGFLAPKTKSAETARAKPIVPARTPVFVTDCATACDGTTLLLALMRRKSDAEPFDD